MRKTVLFLITILYLNFGFAQNPPVMVFVEGGTFKMGNTESTYHDEYPEHTVTLNSFYIGKYEVTIDEYKGFCKTAGLPLPEGEAKMPATKVSWEEAVMFCNWLSRANKLERFYKITRNDKKNIFKVTYNSNANGYRLLTEAEWEFAARGGLNHDNYAYSGSDEAWEVAWYSYTGKTLQNVGRKKANSLGIYDMSGNCQEWCFDIYSETFYQRSPEEIPLNLSGGNERVCRGGNFDSYEEGLRVTKRFYNPQDEKSETLGFRIARNP